MASGYIIVKKFSVLCTEFLQVQSDGHPPVPFYGIPHPRRPEPIGMPQYRGIDREPVYALTSELVDLLSRDGFDCRATPATTLLDEIEVTSGREDGWVTEARDIQRVWVALGDEQAEHEIVFAKEHDDPAV
ncbi:MAG TPA: hypothetical protein P5572_12555, partial [Phycisphaerae bacterium]|nr:hypothetical protein [Phycisphaerae bacterium]